MKVQAARLTSSLLLFTSIGMLSGCGPASEGAASTQQTAPTTVTTRTIEVSSARTYYLFEDLHDIQGLAWTSSVIVQGTVEKVLPAQRFPAVNGPLGTQAPKEYYDAQIYTDYVVRVSQTYRGRSRDTVTVREMGGTANGFTLDVDEHQNPPMAIGDEVVLFLVADDASQPNGAYWTNSGGQGFWRVSGQQVVPVDSNYPTLQVDAVGDAIANAFQQGPPTGLAAKKYSLAEAPPGPDLPSITTPAAP